MPKIPRATYRLQMHAGFTLDQAAELVDYLAELGVSHLYASPYLQAAPGSTHGYDVMDPTRVNEELGGAKAHERLCRALGENGLGQVLDIVPNHMAISGPHNVWWWNVLENGPSSPYAAFFDVDWDSPESRLGNKIMLPILGNHYGRVLEAGEIKLARHGDTFTINYYEHKLPVAPRSLAGIMARAAKRAESDDLAFLADALEQLPLPTVTDRESTRKRYRNVKVIGGQLRYLLANRTEIASAIDSVVAEINVDPEQLDEILEHQNYRIAFWRAAARDLGYRRFFDINTLVGVRVEDERVMAETHRLITEWLQGGVIDGVRIDHPDGLLDPEQYLRRLRAAAPEGWIVVEKILHPGEKLPVTWPVDGTTGYDFLSIVGRLLINQEAEQPLTDFYAEFTGESTDYPTVAREKKHQVMHSLFGSDVNRLTELAMRICERHRRYRDYTRYEVNEGLKEVIACFPVYRSYVRPETEQIRTEDRAIINTAIKAARKNREELDPELFDFIRALLFKEHRGDLEIEFAMRFQQLTGPITAKGIEDTAFYCFNRMICLNEVGGDPAEFGLSVEKFHSVMSETFGRHPNTMLATSTHDTKRSGDVRARLAVLSEIPGPWIEAVRRWAERNEQYRKDGFPDRNTEYLLYQTIVGAWPIGGDRLVPYMVKAIREAKVHTSWTRPEAKYEDAVTGFASSILGDADFCAEVESFVAQLIWPGRVNSLTQTLIKLTAPGVPDIYQGTEIWDLSLVDPDNRRPVDYEHRRQLLREMTGLDCSRILQQSDCGLPKLWVVTRTLGLRQRMPEPFRSGPYRAVSAQGDRGGQVVAFTRGDQVMVLVPRLPLTVNGQWGNTAVEIPPGQWRNEFTGVRHTGGTVEVQGIFDTFPVALLAKEASA